MKTSLLLAALSGCRNDPDSGKLLDDDLIGDSADDSADDSAGDSDSGAPLSFPWDDPGFWTDPGPLADLLWPAEDPVGPGASWRVRIATSPDGASWTAVPDPVMVGFSALSLLVVETEDGPGVVISGVFHAKAADHFGLTVEPHTLYGVASRDLQTWSSFGLPVEGSDYVNILDPALWLDHDGALQAVWFGVDDQEVDPATLPGPHPFPGGPWSDGAFHQRPDPLLAIEGTTDPVVCPMGGEDWMFASTAEGTVAARDPSGAASDFAPVGGFLWPGVSVPWCRSEGADTLLIGQSGGGMNPPEQLLVHPDGSSAPQPALYAAAPFDPSN